MKVEAFKQINAFAYQVNRQSNTRHLSWIKQFGGRLHSEILDPLGAGVPPLLTAAIAQYDGAEQHEDDCYLIIVKSEKTELIAQIDSERDSKYVGLKSLADALSRIGSADQKQWAAQLLDLIAHYKVDISERYDDETTKMSQLLQVLKGADWTARVAGLGLTATVDELYALNQQLKTLIQQRNDELANVTPQAMLQARQASDEAYALVVTIINALAITDWADGASHYDQAIARINQDQDYYLKNVFAQTKPAAGGSGSGSGSGSGGSQGGSSQGGAAEGGGSQQDGSGSEGSGSGSEGSGSEGSGSEGSGDSGGSGSGDSGGTGSITPGSGDNGGDNGGGTSTPSDPSDPSTDGEEGGM